jgi:Arc/MetJ family transcription regulator
MGPFIHIEAVMRTNIEIDDELLAETMKVTGQRTKRATVEEAMRRAVRQQELRDALESIRGIGWEGDLDEMRQGRFYDEKGNLVDDADK